MFQILLLSISIVGYFLFLINTARMRVLIAPFALACFITTSIYFFAIFGLLAIGAKVTLVMGLIFGLISLLRDGVSLKIDKAEYIALTGWFLSILICYFAIPNNFMFFLWDEVGGWARSQKLIYETDALLNANSPFSLRSYPPGQQIFQYFITKATFWSEKNLLLAQNVFIFSALLAVVGALFKRPLWASLVYVSLLPVIYFFNFDYNTIYCDPLVAAVFAGCLALAIKPVESRVDIWVLAICLSGFLLLKDIAFVLTVLVLFVYVLGLFHSSPFEPDITRRDQIIRTIKGLGICLTAVSIVILSWKWYVSVIGTEKTEMLRLTLEGWMQEPYRQRAGKTITAFVHAILKSGYFVGEFKKISLNLSMLMVIFMAIGFGGLVVLFSSKGKRGHALLIVLASGAGAVAYLLLLLWLYLTYFTEYEGTRLASFDRYSMTYLLAWLLVSFAWLMSVLSEKYKQTYFLLIPFICAVAVFCFTPVRFYADIRRLELDQVSFEKRKATQALSDQVRQHIKPGEKVYFLAQNSNGYERHLFDYAMLPYPPNDCWSVGKKYNEADVWTCDRPLGLLIKNYAYLAIYAADERFWKDNAELFDPKGVGKTRGVYKITVTPKHQYQLQLVEQ